MENISSLQETEFSGSCDENYLEIRLGTEEGRRIKKFCSGSQPTGHVHTNSGGVYVKWVKPQGDTAASFSGKWRTAAVSCCDKILLDSYFTSYSGFYSLDAATGHYKQEGGENILFSSEMKFGYAGWFVGTDTSTAGVLNPVCFHYLHIDIYLNIYL